MDKSINKKQVIKMLPYLSVLFILIAMGTFAFNKVDILGVQSLKIVNTQETSIKLVEGDKDITLDNTPMSDAAGKAQTTYYDFSVVGTSNVALDLDYYIYLIPKDGASVDSKYVKLYLTKVENNTETVVLDTTTIDSLDPFGDYKLIKNDVFNFTSNTKTSQTTNYRIRVWLAEDAVLQEEIDPSVEETDDGINISGSSGGYNFTLGVTNKVKVSPTLTFAQSKVGTDGLETVTHTIDSTLQVGSEFATEYRYRGGDSTVKNYVTFNNETWRIIGILPTEDTDGNVEYRFKIIRDTSIGSYYWNSTQDSTTSSYNNWVTGTLNTYLNGDYYNSLSTDAQNMIGTAKYYLGGYNNELFITSDVMWQYERKSSGSTYYYGTNPIVQSDTSKKIALMYASDYGYAASTSCTSTLYNYSESTDCNTTGNWLDKSQDEWILPQDSSLGFGAFIVSSSGYVGDRNEAYFQLAARPVLHLASKVKIKGGTGISSDPYILGLVE